MKLKDAVDSPQDVARKVRNALKITGTCKILLALAWTNNESRRLFEMYPEMQTADVTKKVNAEKRPLFMMCGKTSSNEGYCGTWIYLPSESRWVFHWNMDIAVPSLHNSSTLSRMRVMLTDEDDRQVTAFDALHQPGQHYQSTLHRLCAWHKLNRNLAKSSDFASLVNNLDPTGIEEWNLVVAWLWDLTENIETVEEEEVSLRLLDTYLGEDEGYSGTTRM